MTSSCLLGNILEYSDKIPLEGSGYSLYAGYLSRVSTCVPVMNYFSEPFFPVRQTT